MKKQNPFQNQARLELTQSRQPVTHTFAAEDDAKRVTLRERERAPVHPFAISADRWRRGGHEVVRENI